MWLNPPLDGERRTCFVLPMFPLEAFLFVRPLISALRAVVHWWAAPPLGSHLHILPASSRAQAGCRLAVAELWSLCLVFNLCSRSCLL